MRGLWRRLKEWNFYLGRIANHAVFADYDGASQISAASDFGIFTNQDFAF